MENKLEKILAELDKIFEQAKSVEVTDDDAELSNEIQEVLQNLMLKL